MGRKLTAEEVNQRIIDFPNEGFDTCKCCDGVEPQGMMLSVDDDSFDLICKECDELHKD